MTAEQIREHSLEPSEEGNQPIRVLNFRILEYFENEELRFDELLEIAKGDGIEHYSTDPLKIVFKFRDTKVENAAYARSNNTILLHETFLSYLWCVCFSSIVNFKESIHKPRLGRASHEGLIKHEKYIYDYSKSLLVSYSRWDKTKPNPEYYSRESAWMINVTTDAYLDAVWFIVLHEYAHILYGHTGRSFLGEDTTAGRFRYDEIQADQFASKMCDINLDNTEDGKKEERLTGFVLGLLALMMSGNHLDYPNYPHIHVRVVAVLNTISWSELNLAWGVCASVFQRWANEYGYSNLKVRTEYKNDKEYCMHLGSVLQSTISEEAQAASDIAQAECEEIYKQSKENPTVSKMKLAKIEKMLALTKDSYSEEE